MNPEIYTMKRILFGLGWIILFAAGSCFNPPEFSNIPTVSVESVRIKEVAGAGKADSLIIVMNFTDGDGNIGLDGSESSPPFNERWYFLINPIQSCENGVPAPCTKISYVDETNLNNYVTFKLRSSTRPDLPDWVDPYICRNYSIIRNENNFPIDTLYSELNVRYNNLLIDLEVKNAGTFTKYELSTVNSPKCEIYGLSGRLPILAKNGDFSLKLPLDGSIVYRVGSSGLYEELRNKTIRLRVWLIDRDGNISTEEGVTSEEIRVD